LIRALAAPGPTKEGPPTGHGVEFERPDWSSESRSLAAHIYGESDGVVDDIYFIANARWEAHEFALPTLLGRCWHRVVDTTKESPKSSNLKGIWELLIESFQDAKGEHRRPG
jgi:pullulanase/glycogen debranching enzyme